MNFRLIFIVSNVGRGFSDTIETFDVLFHNLKEKIAFKLEIVIFLCKMFYSSNYYTFFILFN